jgi:2-oxoglutarate ferredoxin oxidoreductase subunit delta
MSTITKPKGAIQIDIEKCKGCEICVVSCPKNVIKLSDQVNSKGYHFSSIADADACIGCANCAIVCPDGVISVYKEKNIDL